MINVRKQNAQRLPALGKLALKVLGYAWVHHGPRIMALVKFEDASIGDRRWSCVHGWLQKHGLLSCVALRREARGGSLVKSFSSPALPARIRIRQIMRSASLAAVDRLGADSADAGGDFAVLVAGLLGHGAKMGYHPHQGQCQSA
jgi:hypothetical protein